MPNDDQIDDSRGESLENSGDESFEEEESNYAGSSAVEESNDESSIEEEVIPPPTEPIQAITDLIFTDSLLYGGFCFGGASKTLASVTHLKIWDQEVPLAEIPAKCQLNAANLLVELTPEWIGLDKLKTKIGKKIGCSETFFELLFRKILVYETGAEVARQKGEEMAPNQFGTLFIQPPSTHTGGEMKVYRKLGADDEEEEMHLKFGADFGTSASKWHFGFISADAEYEIDPILSGSRLMFVFAVVWSSDQGLRFHGPEQIDQITTQLELQRVNGDFLVAFLSDTYENFEGVGERALNHADRSLLHLLEVANERLEEPFKVVLVSVIHQEWEEGDNIKELVLDYKPELWYNAGKIEQKWFDLDGNPWPYRSKAKLEVMKNVLNPKRKPLKQLWSCCLPKELWGIPSLDDDDVIDTSRVTYRRSLLVLWQSDMTIERMAELEGWDAACSTLINKSPDSAAIVSLLKLFKEKINGIPYDGSLYESELVNELIEDKIIRLIYDYIAEKSLLDALPSYIDAFFKSKFAFLPIFLTSNEEIWKRSLPVLSSLENVSPYFFAEHLKMAQKEQAPKERCCQFLVELIKHDVNVPFPDFALQQILELADETLMTTICEVLVETRRFVLYFEKILTPEFAPLKEKFWSILYSMLERRIEILKDAIAKGSKPFDENFPDLEAIFPKESAESNWLLKAGNYCYRTTHTLWFDNIEKAKQVAEKLNVYNSMINAVAQSWYGGANVYLSKTDNFWRYQEENEINMHDLRNWEKIKAEIDQKSPMKKTENE